MRHSSQSMSEAHRGQAAANVRLATVLLPVTAAWLIAYATGKLTPMIELLHRARQSKIETPICGQFCAWNRLARTGPNFSDLLTRQAELLLNVRPCCAQSSSIRQLVSRPELSRSRPPEVIQFGYTLRANPAKQFLLKGECDVCALDPVCRRVGIACLELRGGPRGRAEDHILPACLLVNCWHAL